MVAITKYLIQHQEALRESQITLIEEQRKIAPKNLWLMHHIIASILVLCPQTTIYEVPSSYKTKLLNCPKGLDIKKWSVYRCLQIFQQRGDIISYNVIMSTRKRDDLSDIVLQILAFLVKMRWMSPPPHPSQEEILYLMQCCS